MVVAVVLYGFFTIISGDNGTLKDSSHDRLQKHSSVSSDYV